MRLASICRGNVEALARLQTVRFGWVSRLRWSPRGDMLAIGGGGGGGAIYADEFGGAPSYHFREHSGPVKDLAFSPNGGLLASCSADTTIALYSMSSGKPSATAVLRGHRNAVNALAFSADGKYLASGGADHSVRIWTVKSGAQRASIEGHPDEVTSLCFADDGARLFSGCRDGKIRALGSRGGAPVRGHRRAWRPDSSDRPSVPIVNAGIGRKRFDDSNLAPGGRFRSAQLARSRGRRGRPGLLAGRQFARQRRTRQCNSNLGWRLGAGACDAHCSQAAGSCAGFQSDGQSARVRRRRQPGDALVGQVGLGLQYGVWAQI